MNFVSLTLCLLKILAFLQMTHFKSLVNILYYSFSTPQNSEAYIHNQLSTSHLDQLLKWSLTNWWVWDTVLKSLTPLILFLNWDSTKVLINASSINVQLTNIQHIFYASDLILTFDSNQKKKKREKKIQSFGPSTHLNSLVCLRLGI